MTRSVRLGAVVSLGLALLLNASGVCLCCLPTTSEAHEHSCCAPKGRTIAAPGQCCAQMTDPKVQAVAERAGTAVAVHHVATNAPWLPLIATGNPGRFPYSFRPSHPPPSTILRI